MVVLFDTRRGLNVNHALPYGMTIWIFDSTGMLAGMRAREVELELQLLESTLEPKTK